MDEQSASIRLSVFLSVFVVMAIWEALLPARHSPVSKVRRWWGNLAMIVVGSVAARVVLPMTLTGIALWSAEHNFGVFHWLDTAIVFATILGVLLLDVVIYWQHRLSHTIPILWRLHQVHHADGHVDTTTGLRFHPFEIVMSLAIKALVVLLFGIPAVAVVIFEVALNGFAIFNHANIRLPKKWDDRLSYIFITQRVHRVHHSVKLNESNSNFGFSVSWWDRLFGSYKSQGEKSDETLDIGQNAFPANNDNASLWRLLTMPFAKRK
ncbi:MULTISPECIES: sterol desaturase family protein [unclassified Vibrio]|uniref:Sterol desaturase family protein n=1 Tax=Vibrio sp. HB236076 TaxID=3232307 RepID=A0AB39H9Q2_9VIBR|nr:sterol desaturase family protein [Vibrio sp. HB161653]MDP5254066.1 sterol desaturase family protein [Vibrio sp. HB161653]